MTTDGDGPKPGQPTAPAFLYADDGQADDGPVDVFAPLRRYHYTLTSADALAFLQLPAKPSARVRVALGCWLFAGGVIVGLMPDRVTGGPGSWQFVIVLLAVVALQFGLALLARALWRRIRAQRLVPVPLPGLLEESGDCLAGTVIGEEGEATLSPELIGEIVETPTRLFIRNWNTTIIVPVAAFDDAGEMSAFAAHWRALSKGPYYFEA